MGEGGVCLINDSKWIERAEIIREKGTNRSKFWRGEIDKYTWVDVGSSYLPSELNTAYLWAQLEIADEIKQDRLASWNAYYEGLSVLRDAGKIELPYVPEECEHNGHIFYIKTSDIEERQCLIEHLKKHDVHAVFHYLPLHSTIAGKKYGRFSGEDRYTTKESERLVRLPIYYGMTEVDNRTVISAMKDYFVQ